ncbi:putative salicylate synthase [Streptomyces sp. NBRC 110611]|uniref:salicylate synthase n=1 Tax=Streptomyces sp. NBRC 110611 TaxID=1621259 RepID=UPI00082D1610|nr:salicylate synthase [Streptomyces sp. NBRC 110611]GAU68932.1 putative salicylate synthase [Streptomyces sp. NBRC 110611]
MNTHYRTAVVDTPREPLDTATGLAASGLFGTYVVYEEPGCWSVAGGVAAEVTVTARTVRTAHAGEVVERPWHGDPLAAVREFLAGLPIAGWTAYGWCAFELAHALAGAAPDHDDVLVHLVVPETEIRLTGGRALIRSLSSGALADAEAAIALADAPAAPARQQVRVDLDADADIYRKGVESLVADIRAGVLHKAVLSRVVPVEGEIDFPASYAHGRRSNTPARSFLLDMAGLKVFGFSPETVAEVDAEGRVTSQPLAGTRALAEDPEVSRELREDLLGDAKEVHEHAISVKVAMDELAGPCEPGSVVVQEYLAVEERGSVQHLASRVGGRLPEGAGPWGAFAALFPAVTASGVPKPAAYEAIRRYEPQRRGPYAGTVLKVTQDGAMDAALVLRSAFAENGRTWLRAGGGVMGQSRAERELEETYEKLRSVSRFLVSRPADAE